MLSVAAERDVWTTGAQDVEGAPSQGGEILGPTIAPVAGMVLVETGVEHPVLGVLDAPMDARRVSELCCAECGRREIVAPNGAGVAVALGGGLNHGEHGDAEQCWLVEIATIGEQPAHVVADEVPARLQPAMIGVDGGRCLKAHLRIG